MKYTVYVADKKSGAERKVLIEAESIEAAKEQAVKDGWILTDKIPTASRVTTATVSVSQPQTTNEIPDYAGLSVASSILKVIAIVYAVAGIIGGLIAMTLNIGLGLTYILAGLGMGGLMLGLSAASAAIRDMAQNSFAIRKASERSTL